MKLKTNSALFAWVSHWGGLDARFNDTVDMCRLLRLAFLRTPALVFAASVVGALLTGLLVGAPLFALFVYFTLGYLDTDLFIPLEILASAAAVMALIILAGGGIEVVKDKLATAPPGFLRTAYRGWKEKYCPIIELERTA